MCAMARWDSLVKAGSGEGGERSIEGSSVEAQDRHSAGPRHCL